MLLKLGITHTRVAWFSTATSALGTASYVASGKETDMVEYLAPIIAPLAKYMKRVPEEKEGKFILDELPGAGLEPDLELMRKMGVIKHIEFMS